VAGSGDAITGIKRADSATANSRIAANHVDRRPERHEGLVSGVDRQLYQRRSPWHPCQTPDGDFEVPKPQALFAFKVVEEMMSRKMYGLGEAVVSYVGTGGKQKDDYSD
jgi:hypothetical protein